MSANVWNPGSDILSVNANTTLVKQIFTATEGQTVFNLTLFNYTPNVGSLLVFRNGQLISEIIETSSSSFTVSSTDLNLGDQIIAFGFVGITATFPAALAATGVSFLQSGTGAESRTLDSKLKEWVSVTDFGASLSNTPVENLAAFTFAVNYCVTSGKALFIPGLADGQWWDLSIYFPVRQTGVTATIHSLQSYNNLVVFGEGKNSRIRTVWATGADCLQLNGVADVTFMDIAVSGTITAPSTNGVNGCSMTNGGHNITLLRVHAQDLPWYGGGGYIDGGKAFTPQPDHPTLGFSNIKVIECTANNCPIGFEIDVDGPLAVSSTDLAPKAILVSDCIFDVWYQGVVLSQSENGSTSNLIPSEDIQIVNNIIKGAQYGIVGGRASGAKISGNRILNMDPSVPSTVPWDTGVVPVIISGCVITQFTDNFIYYARADNLFHFGGSTLGTGDGSSQLCTIIGNKFISDNTTDALHVLNAGGNVAKNSTFVGNSFVGYSGARISDVAILTNTLNNVFMDSDIPAYVRHLAVNVTGGEMDTTASDHLINGKLGFAYSDGYSCYHTIYRDGLAIAFKSAAGSAGDIIAYKFLTNAGAIAGGFRNDGAAVTGGRLVASAVGALGKVLPIYDGNNTLLGYVPIHDTYTP